MAWSAEDQTLPQTQVMESNVAPLVRRLSPSPHGCLSRYAEVCWSLQIFFSAHGVPQSYVNQDGDPYKEEMEQCVDMIMDRLKALGHANPFTLAYQSRVGPVRNSQIQAARVPCLLRV